MLQQYMPPKDKFCYIAMIDFPEFVTKRNIVEILVHQDFYKTFNTVVYRRKLFGLEKVCHNKSKEMAKERLLKTELKELPRNKTSN